MKKITLFLLLSIGLYSCQKDNLNTGEIIVDPPFATLISRDSIATGQFWGITIGQSAPDVYTTIQNMSSARGITNLGIVGNVFGQLDSIKNAFPLYSSLFIDERKGTSKGIQFSFKNDKVDAIFTNAGAKIAQWPSASSANGTITVGDAVDGVYNKLVVIKNTGKYNNLLERLSIFNKIVSKPYDLNMSASRQWYFIAPVNNTQYYLVHLNFTAGKLASVTAALYQN